MTSNSLLSRPRARTPAEKHNNRDAPGNHLAHRKKRTARRTKEESNQNRAGRNQVPIAPQESRNHLLAGRTSGTRPPNNLTTRGKKPSHLRTHRSRKTRSRRPGREDNPSTRLLRQAQYKSLARDKPRERKHPAGARQKGQTNQPPKRRQKQP